MGNARHIGRVGALAVALGLGFAVAATPAVGYAETTDSVTCQPADSAEPDTTALILGGTGLPTPNDYYVDTVRDHFIAPTHPGQINYCAVTTPEEFWPITGLFRLIGVGLSAVDPQRWPPEFLAAFFPDEPWWKLSGLFDLTVDQSVQAGVADLEAAMTKYGNDHLVINGYSQGANIAVREKRKLAEQYPAGTTAPDIDFVLGGDGNLPNGGLLARFPGLHIPILDLSFNGPEPTDTQFDTIVITRQYDGWADFPLYPLNLVADLNALLGFFFVHTDPFDVSLADPTTPPPIKRQHGDTDYYFFETEDLPLFAPLRTLGVPEPLIDVVEPFFRVLVELGYDRSISPWEPTPARLIPPLNPGKVTADLVNAIGDGINNAAALFGSPLPLRSPAPVTLAAPATEAAEATPAPPVASTRAAPSRQDVTDTTNADVSRQVTPTKTVPETGQAASAKKVTETVGAEEASTKPRAASAANSESVTTGRALHGSLGRREHLRHLLHRSNGDHPITRTVAADDGSAKAGSSTVESYSVASSSTGSNSPKDNSLGADAGDS